MLKLTPVRSLSFGFVVKKKVQAHWCVCFLDNAPTRVLLPMLIRHDRLQAY